MVWGFTLGSKFRICFLVKPIWMTRHSPQIAACVCHAELWHVELGLLGRWLSRSHPKPPNCAEWEFWVNQNGLNWKLKIWCLGQLQKIQCHSSCIPWIRSESASRHRREGRGWRCWCAGEPAVLQPWGCQPEARARCGNCDGSPTDYYFA